MISECVVLRLNRRVQRQLSTVDVAFKRLLEKRSLRNQKLLKARSEKQQRTAETLDHAISEITDVIDPLLKKCCMQYASAQQASAVARNKREEDGDTAWTRVRSSLLESSQNARVVVGPMSASALDSESNVLAPEQLSVDSAPPTLDIPVSDASPLDALSHSF